MEHDAKPLRFIVKRDLARLVADGLIRVYCATESADMRLGTARIS